MTHQKDNCARSDTLFQLVCVPSHQLCLLPHMQEYALDFQAISLAFAATVVPPLQQMSRHRPPAQVGIWPNFVLVGTMVLLFFCSNCTTMWYMCTRAWYTGGNGTADNVRVFPFTVSSLLHVHKYHACIHSVVSQNCKSGLDFSLGSYGRNQLCPG